jgi:hypothetical protein
METELRREGRKKGRGEEENRREGDLRTEPRAAWPEPLD